MEGYSVKRVGNKLQLVGKTVPFCYWNYAHLEKIAARVGIEGFVI
jgi:hypothetical protein